jgi:hypothetical protein
MFFDHLDERNAMVQSVPHFDNFTKWTILVISNFIPSTLVLNQQRPPVEWSLLAVNIAYLEPPIIVQKQEK